MSLINDALKRAKETQQKNPQAPPPAIPVHVTAEHSRSGAPAWLWFVIILLLFGLGAFLIGKSMSKRGETSSANSVTANNPTTQAPTSTTPVSNPKPAPSTPPVVAVANPTPPSTTITVAENKVTEVAPQTNATEAAIKPAPPAPPPLKLQSIIYDPKRPSVMINGKLLYTGDSLGDLRVVEIRRDGVTLVGPGVTNVLSQVGY